MDRVINGGRGLPGFFWNSIIAFKIIFRLIESLPSACLWKERLDTAVQKVQRLKLLMSNYELVASCLFAGSKKEKK